MSNGIGIDPQYHQKIFEAFYRSRDIEDKEGTGLGLAIVERIVRNHAGSVWVESKKGVERPSVSLCRRLQEPSRSAPNYTEDYEEQPAQYMVYGVDVWLNNPLL